MIAEVFLLVKYPYTAGVITTIWISTAILIAIDPTLPVVTMITTNMFVSVLLSLFGFRGKSTS